MIKRIIVVLSIFFSLTSSGQEQTSSPYSSYGLGEIEYKGTVLEIAVPERNQNISSIKNEVNVKVQRVRNTENSLLKDLSKKLVKAKSEYRKKLKQANILRIKEDKEKSISSPDIFISGVT